MRNQIETITMEDADTIIEAWIAEERFEMMADGKVPEFPEFVYVNPIDGDVSEDLSWSNNWQFDLGEYL